MKRIELNARHNSKHLVMLLTALTLIFLGGVNKAHAQWSSPDASGNVYNTNTGNVGVNMGTTPINGWSSNFRALQIGTDGYLMAWSSTAGNTGNDSMHIGQNSYFDGTSWRYQVGSFGASNYYQLNGVHAFRVAGNGTAGGNITWTTAMFINNTGNVGIGTTAPTNPLTIARSGSSPYTNRPASELLQLVDKTDNTPQILFGSAYNGMWLRYTGTDGTATNQRLGVITGGAGEALVINNDGKVGIGTTTPQTTLDVQGNINVGGTAGNGNITVSGNINAKYQDVAEWVQSSRAIPAATVVVLDPQRSNQVIPSTQSYDTRVAGVVSERPGLALGEAGANKVLVATTGRVRVKVDATRAPIHVGDLLVTSDTEGVAMKSEPVDLGGVKIHRPGTLIGKALENLEKGTGEILVLLSLQ